MNLPRHRLTGIRKQHHKPNSPLRIESGGLVNRILMAGTSRN